MPIKKNKYNARFPPARIKKIMQIDEEIGKVAAAVPVIISRSLEMFVEHLLKKTYEISTNRGARTLTPSHIKMCIASESRFDFLKDLVSAVPDLQGDCDDQPPTPVSTLTTAPSFNTQTSSSSQLTKPTAKAQSSSAIKHKQDLPLDRQLSTLQVRGRKRKAVLDSDDIFHQSKETKMKKIVSSKESKTTSKGAKMKSKESKKSRKGSKKTSKTGKRGRKKKNQFLDDDRIEEDVKIPLQTSQGKNDINYSDDDDEEEISAPTFMNGEQLERKFDSSEVTQIVSKQKAIMEVTLSVSTTTVSENPSSIETTTAATAETAATATTTTTSANVKPSLLTTKANSFSSPATTTVPLKPVRTNHIPMHLVSATAMATAKPTTFHRSRSFHESAFATQRSDQVKSGPFAFSLTYPVPFPRSVGPESKTQMSVPTPTPSTELTGRNTSDQQGESDKSKTSVVKSVSWSSHGGVDEDYDA